MFNLLFKFRKENRGAFAINFALMIVPLLAFAGAAIDYNMMASSRAKLQQDLDAALLAAIHEPNLADSRKTAKTYFPSSALIIKDFDYNSDPYSRSVSATADKTYDTVIMHFFGSNRMNVSVRSEVTAGLTPSSVRIRGLSAHGWFRKLIRLMVSRPDGTVESVSEYEWVPTAIVSGRAVGDLNSDRVGWLDLGNITDVWFDMRVFDTGGFMDNQMSVDLYGSDQTFRFDDPIFSNRVYIGGDHLRTGKAVTFLSLAGCGESELVEWEDLGSPGTDDSIVRDFTFTIDVECDAINPQSIMIKK